MLMDSIRAPLLNFPEKSSSQSEADTIATFCIFCIIISSLFLLLRHHLLLKMFECTLTWQVAIIFGVNGNIMPKEFHTLLLKLPLLFFKRMNFYNFISFECFPNSQLENVDL